MRKTFRSLVAAAAFLSSSAFAADLPDRGPAVAPAPVLVAMNWTGFYVGVHVGGMDARDRWNFTNGAVGAGVWAGFNGARAALSHTGSIGGLQAGYMQQFGTLVAGIDLSVSGANVRRTIASPFFPGEWFSMRQAWFGLVQGRIGVAFDRFLVFAQGGLAVGQHKIRLTTVSNFNDDGASETRLGWTIGAGINYKLTSNWILGAQYNYVDFGNHTFRLQNNGAPNDLIRSSKRDHVVKLTLDYQFGSVTGPVVAKY